MRHRVLLAAGLALLAAACGGAGADPPAAGAPAADLVVTRDFGARVLLRARVRPGQPALTALRRVADVDTRYGGRFVTAIDGLRGDRSAGWDWLYFVNGLAPDQGAGDYTLHAGDRQWWDYREWRDLIQIPVAVGAWPEPFVHGFDGRRPVVAVTGLPCAARLAGALRRAGADVGTRPSPFSVSVATFDAAADELRDWRGRGLTVSLAGDDVLVYRPGRGAVPEPGAEAVIAGYRPGPVTGRSAAVVVAGRNREAACAAARALAGDAGLVTGAYAVALDGDGRPVAYGGRP